MGSSFDGQEIRQEKLLPGIADVGDVGVVRVVARGVQVFIDSISSPRM